jgi:RNA polymerase sigma-70 factor (ECF subfamily)
MAVVVRDWTSVQQHGADEAFERLFFAEYGRTVAIANRVLADPHEAEDIAQEVFCDFHEKHRADAPYAPAWLHVAASHAALNAVRGRKRRQQREAADVEANRRLFEAAEAKLDPQWAAELNERRLEVRAALARLPLRSATILALRYSGLSYAEVAAAMGVPVDQVGTQLRRSEAALRKEMAGAAHR